MTNVTITHQEKLTGYHRIFLSNGHQIRIIDMGYVCGEREWHIFAFDNNANEYIEVCHPFNESWKACKSLVPEILSAWNELEDQNKFPHIG
tara:strand:+ start:79 stop:351 length:273 start_codon:yes stop_codon:yes gene_type:complete